MLVLRKLRGLHSLLEFSSGIRYEARGLAKTQSHSPQNHLLQLVKADAQYVQKHRNGMLEVFPNVKGTLNNMFNNLNTNLDPMYKCQHTTKAIGRANNQIIFEANFTVNWPKQISFVGHGFKKKVAELNAMVKALEFLYNENLITPSGHPITVTQDEKERLLDEWSRPPTIALPTHLMKEGWSLLDEFDESLQEYLNERNEPGSFIPSGHQEDSEDEHIPSSIYDVVESEQEENDNTDRESVLDLLTGREYEQDESAMGLRSVNMLHQLSSRMNSLKTSEGKKPLPISEYENLLERALEDHQVVVVAGDTGCGKSTQVPQMILNKWIREGRGAECNILISQPRRISAISLAKYIASERQEKLGESVGYHVRLNYKRLKNPGGIMFLTTGMLLQGLHSNPSLKGISHVIVDEVHERSVPTDLLLILLRRLMQSNSDLKLILMSASLSTVELQNYFGKDESTLIEVPGALYPLKRYYLGNLYEQLKVSPKNYPLQSLMTPGSYPIVNIDLVLDVIKTIDSSRPPGAILCFLPGWQDISVVQMRLQDDPSFKEKLHVLPLHSRLPASEQEQIFEHAPDGMRKVVLATNIAETSLTVEDVVYVIDTGCHKEQRYDSKKDVNVLGNHWISKANSQQRAGRAGRVQPGEVFHLYSDAVYEDMSNFPVPEIMRISLEHVILQCKAHSGDESARSFLSDGLNVPSMRLITAAVKNLKELGMLNISYEQDAETLTPLGRRVVHFSTPPPLSKALIYSSIFRCVEPILCISSALSSGRSIFFNDIEMRSDIRKTKIAVNNISDLLAMLGLIRQWGDLSHYNETINFCNANNLSHRVLMFNNGIEKVYSDHLRDSYMVDDDITEEDSRWNYHQFNSQLILGVLLAGVNRILYLQKGVLSKGIFRKESRVFKTLKGSVVETGSDCVLHTIPKELDDDARYLLCVNLTRDDTSRRTIARDLSLLQPLTLAIFGGYSLDLQSSEDKYILIVDKNHKLSFEVEEETGNFLCHLRSAVNKMVEVTIETRGLDVSLPNNFESYCDRLVNFISKLMESNKFKSRNSRMQSILHDDDD